MMMMGLRADELDPLQRARVQRIAGGAASTARLLSAALTSVADWLANSGLPVVVQEDEAGDQLRDALKEAFSAVSKIETMLAAADGQSSGRRALDVLSSPPLMEELAAACLEVGRRVRNVETGVTAVASKAESVLRRPGELSAASFRMRRRLNAGASALTVDSVWLEDQVQRLGSETLNKSQANVGRVQRARRRKKEGLSTVTTHYSFSDLNALRVLGFLRGSAPYSKEDITAAFEAFMQAALAIASYSAEVSDEELQSGSGWDETRRDQWADRLAALARVRKAGEVKSEA